MSTYSYSKITTNGLNTWDPAYTVHEFRRQGGGGDRTVNYRRSFYSLYRYTDKRGVQHFTKVPTYRRTPPAVRDVPHNWSCTVEEKGTYGGTVNGNLANSNNWNWTGDPRNGFDNNAQIELVNKLRSSIQGSDFDMGVFLGTAHQSLRTITESATKIALTIRQLKKGEILPAARTLLGKDKFNRLSGAKKARLYAINSVASAGGESAPSHIRIVQRNGKVKRVRNPKGPRGLPPEYSQRFPESTAGAAAAGWLELQYGWKPVLRDLKTGSEALAEQLHFPRRKRYFARIKKPYPRRMCAVKTGTFWPLYPSSENNFASRQIIAYMDEKDVPSMVGFSNLPSVVLELTPWSFVADWIIPIGDYLSARGVASALVGTFVTTTLEHLKVNAPRGEYSANKYASFPKNFWHRFIYNRSVSSVLSVPLPTVKPLSGVLSWTRAANALALLQQTSR